MFAEVYSANEAEWFANKNGKMKNKKSRNKVQVYFDFGMMSDVMSVRISHSWFSWSNNGRTTKMLMRKSQSQITISSPPTTLYLSSLVLFNVIMHTAVWYTRVRVSAHSNSSSFSIPFFFA